MKLESQVVSLEYAKRLNELGVPQESLFYWTKCCTSYQDEQKGIEWSLVHESWHDDYTGEWGDGHELKDQESYSAYTVAELGELLKPHIKKLEIKVENDNLFDPDYWAKMLIYLLKNGLLILK